MYKIQPLPLPQRSQMLGRWGKQENSTSRVLVLSLALGWNLVVSDGINDIFVPALVVRLLIIFLMYILIRIVGNTSFIHLINRS